MLFLGLFAVLALSVACADVPQTRSFKKSFSPSAIILDRVARGAKSMSFLEPNKFTVAYSSSGAYVTISLKNQQCYAEQRLGSECESFILPQQSNTVLPLISGIPQPSQIGDMVILCVRSDIPQREDEVEERILNDFDFRVFNGQAIMMGIGRSRRDILQHFLESHKDTYSYVIMRSVKNI